MSERAIITESGITLNHSGYIDHFSYEDVVEISAYKIDQIMVDCVYCDITTQNTKMALRSINEDMADFQDIMLRLSELPGFYKNWREAVILPPFEKNFTVIYRPGVDLESIYAETPLVRPLIDEPQGNSAFRWWWMSLVALVAILIFIGSY